MKFAAKDFFIENKLVFYSIVGLLTGGIGFVFNNILQRIYSFHKWSVFLFNSPGDITLTEIFGSALQSLGYKSGVMLFTPDGVVNVLVYIAIVLVIVMMVDALKKDIPQNQKIFLLFAIVAFGFNTFIFMSTEFTPRFFIPVLIYIVPCIAILISNTSLGDIKRYVLGVLFAVILFTSSFSTVQTVINSNTNKDKEGVANFLRNSDYTFGYATFWNANVFTFLTNGKVEMGCLTREKFGQSVPIPHKYTYEKWLTPDRYYEADYKNNEKIIMIASVDEYEEDTSLRIYSSGNLIYHDNFYRVYEYKNHDAFRNGF